MARAARDLGRQRVRAGRRPRLAPGDRALGRVGRDHPARAAALPRRARRLAQRVPARGAEPAAAARRLHARAGADAAPEGVRLRHRHGRAAAPGRDAQAALQPLGPRHRAADPGDDGPRVPRRHRVQGQERLVLERLSAAAGAAALRPDAVPHRRQHALPAVRRLHQELLRLQPDGRLSRRPVRRRPALRRVPAVLRGDLPRVRVRVLQRARPAGDRARRDVPAVRVVRRREPCAVRGARDVPQDDAGQASGGVRDRRVQRVLLARRAAARGRDGAAHRPPRAGVGGVARARPVRRAQPVVAVAHVRHRAALRAQDTRDRHGAEREARCGCGGGVRRRAEPRGARGHLPARRPARRRRTRRDGARAGRALRARARVGLPDGDLRGRPDRGGRRAGQPCAGRGRRAGARSRASATGPTRAWPAARACAGRCRWR